MRHAVEVLRQRVLNEKWYPGKETSADEELLRYITTLERKLEVAERKISNYMWKADHLIG